MANVFEGSVEGQGAKVGIVVSRFNTFVTERLLQGALKCLAKHNVAEEDIDIVHVPGAFEIPMAARRLCSQKRHDAVVCLGAVIRGATPHFDYVAGECARGISVLAESQPIPVLFGVLTTDTVDQAMERAGSKTGNKGWDAALAALEMINLFKKL